MAKARFSLGYEYNNRLTSLSVFASGDELVGSDLTDVIKFTTSFNNEEQLREYLKNSKSNYNIPEEAKFVYLREPDNNYFMPTKVMDIEHICYAGSSSLLEPDAQIQYFKDNKYDVELIEKLYISLIKLLSNVNQVKSLYTDEDKAEDSNSKLISVFKKNKDIINNGKNYLFLFMDEVYSECLEANRRGIDNYEYELDRKDLDYLIKRLYDSITIKKDKKGNFKYNQNNGKIERNSRIIGYFAILISKDMMDKYDELSELYQREYEEAIYKEYLEEMQKQQEIESEKSDLYNYRYDGREHDEEFLTSDDFEEKGLDPESNGYKIRRNV